MKTEKEIRLRLKELENNSQGPMGIIQTLKWILDDSEPLLIDPRELYNLLCEVDRLGCDPEYVLEEISKLNKKAPLIEGVLNEILTDPALNLSDRQINKLLGSLKEKAPD